MAFLGGFGKTIDKVLHNPIFETVFPVVAVGNILAKTVSQRLVGAAEHYLSNAPADHTLTTNDPRLSMYPYALLPQTQPQGGYGSWDYSTQSQAFSIPPAYQDQMSSPAQQTSLALTDQWAALPRL